MRRLSALVLPLLIAGCQGGGDATPPAATVPPKTPVRETPPPKTSEPTTIALVRGDQKVTVGMSPDEALKVFRRAGDNPLDVEQLPPGLSAPYRAKWWESAGHGFGVVTYNDRVVAAMYQEDHANVERMNEFVQVHQQQMGDLQPHLFAGNRVSYWFWEKDGQRLMVCAFRTEKEGISMTTAMGDEVVLDTLGISPSRASTTVDKMATLPPRPNPSENPLSK